MTSSLPNVCKRIGEAKDTGKLVSVHVALDQQRRDCLGEAEYERPPMECKCYSVAKNRVTLLGRIVFFCNECLLSTPYYDTMPRRKGGG